MNRPQKIGMYYVEFDATPYRRGYWVGCGTVYRAEPDRACFRRRKREHAEVAAKRLGRNATVVFQTEEITQEAQSAAAESSAQELQLAVA